MDVSQRLPAKSRVKTEESVSSKRSALPAGAHRDGVDQPAVRMSMNVRKAIYATMDSVRIRLEGTCVNVISVMEEKTV